MLDKLLAALQANKKVIARRALILAGTVAGFVIALSLSTEPSKTDTKEENND